MYTIVFKTCKRCVEEELRKKLLYLEEKKENIDLKTFQTDHHRISVVISFQFKGVN